LSVQWGAANTGNDFLPRGLVIESIQ
jgi:hypothetical protein